MTNYLWDFCMGILKTGYVHLFCAPTQKQDEVIKYTKKSS